MQNMFLFHWLYLLFLALGLVNCSILREENKSNQTADNCMVFPFPERETIRLSNLFNNFSQFIQENDLQSGHSSLRKVLAELKTDLHVERNMPLQAYLMKYQKSLHDEVTLKLKTLHERMVNMEQASLLREIQLNKMSEKMDSLMEIVKSQVITNKFASVSSSASSTVEISSSSKASDCWDHFVSGKETSGVYSIFIQGQEKKVYCDMETDGGGWTTFFLRQKQKTQENFAQNWKSYKNGFGTTLGEHWLGNEILHLMTQSKQYEMRADAESVIGGEKSTGSPVNIWGQWSHFNVDSEASRYRLTLGGYYDNSTMLNGRGFGRNLFFSTTDKKNENGGKCIGLRMGGGFWYDGDSTAPCSWIYPTASYEEISFYDWSTTDVELRFASKLSLKIRPKI